MKPIFVILSCALLFSYCSNNNAQQTGSVIENIDAGRFKEMMNSSEVIILDVRTPEEVLAGYIKGASPINFYDESFAEKINFIQKDKPVLVYCKSGGRSAKAAEVLQTNGFKKVFNLKGGITAWEEKGFEIVKPEGFKDENIQQMTLDDFKKILQTEKPVLIDFHTQWCVPCRKMAPVVDKIGEQYKDNAVVLRIDIDKCKDLAKNYQIQGIPVFIIFKKGEEKWKFNGIIEEDKITAELNKYL